MRFKRYTTAAFAGIAAAMLIAPTAASAEASTSGTAVAKAAPASTLAIICPAKVLRTTSRWFLTSDGFVRSGFFRKGSRLSIYQGEIRKLPSGEVGVKTTTVVGPVRAWVNQGDIARTGEACRS
ncbi:hypothetical protein [Nonomuraea sp. B19D2]|uniref:hypothetical protein n=1 Tax=Nonomuraea sp. B19D2 TaxID=3159561 RepID=UPI0032DBB969